MTPNRTVRKTKEQKLEDLRKQFADLEKICADKLANKAKQIERIASKGTDQDRKDETRRKILYGAMLADRIKNRKMLQSKLTDWMDQYLTRDDDRLFFGFASIKKTNAESQSLDNNVEESNPELVDNVEESIVEKYNVELSRLSTQINHDLVTDVLAQVLNKTVEEAQELAERAADETIFICEDIDFKTAELVRQELEAIGCEVEVNAA